MKNQKIPKKKSKTHLSKAQIERLLDEHLQEQEVTPWRIFRIISEFVTGFEFLRQYKKAVSIFGSARLGFRHEIYQEASRLAYRLAKDGFAVITGGGPGVMEAANKGAYEAEGKSVGINIKLRFKQRANKYVVESEAFKYFFVRKTMLSFASQIYIFFPGGYGTLDELFEMLTLVQTEKIPRIPIILVNKSFWTPLLRWVEDYLYKKNQAIDKNDLKIYYLVDNADEAYRLIRRLMRESNKLKNVHR